MIDHRGILILEESDMAINKLAASCRANIQRKIKNRRDGQRRRQR